MGGLLWFACALLHYYIITLIHYCIITLLLGCLPSACFIPITFTLSGYRRSVGFSFISYSNVRKRGHFLHFLLKITEKRGGNRTKLGRHSVIDLPVRTDCICLPEAARYLS